MIAPPDDKLKPGGNDPLTIAKVNVEGCAVANCWLYGVPTAPSGIVAATPAGLFSNEPMSIFAPTIRAEPRWSVAGAFVLLPASIAGLFGKRLNVCVGPP